MQFLIEAGAINPRTYQPNCNSFREVCQRALDHWLGDRIGDLHCFTPHFELRAIEEVDPGCTSRQRRPSISGPSPMIEIRWKESAVCHWGVGAGLDYLEQSVPRLGSTVLDIMERKGSHAYPLFTPSLALDEASYLYWRGEDDETLVLDEECGDDQAARDAMSNDMITRADIEAAFPAWALDYHRPRLTPKELSMVSINHPCPYVQHAVALACELDEMRTTALYCPEHEGPFIGFGAVLCWRSGDLAIQISDDYANLAWQDEYSDEIGKVTFTLDVPLAMRRWMRKVGPNLAAIRILDALLLHLSERE